MDNILSQVSGFIHSKQFWIYHGFVLSGLWVLLSSIAIFVKRFSLQLHVLIFAIIDFTTIFFAGSAFYRVLPGFSNFFEWNILKQGHVIGGSLFSLLMIVQHLGGVTAFLGKKANPQHRSFGKVLPNLGRIIAAVGWVLAGNFTNAMIVGIISMVLLGLSMVVGPAPRAKSSKPAGSEDQQRSKSPKARRQ